MHNSHVSEDISMRKQLLEDHLLQAMRQKPYAEISVSDLCEQAGLSRKSFYRYFGNKDGCLSALLDRVLLGINSCHEPADCGAEGVSPELMQIMTYWMEQKPLLDLITANGLQSRLLERCFHYVINENRDSLRWLGIKDVVQEPEAAIFAVTGFLAVLMEWCRTGFPRSPSEMAQILTKLWTQPLMQVPGE